MQKIEELQPSQLYISKKKLNKVISWISRDENNYEPIPIIKLADKIVITDGHTRLFALYQIGFQTVRTKWDTDELDIEAYKIYVDWCLDYGIELISDLEYRIIELIANDKLWINPCKVMHDQTRKSSIRKVGS